MLPVPAPSPPPDTNRASKRRQAWQWPLEVEGAGGHEWMGKYVPECRSCAGPCPPQPPGQADAPAQPLRGTHTALSLPSQPALGFVAWPTRSSPAPSPPNQLTSHARGWWPHAGRWHAHRGASARWHAHRWAHRGPHARRGPHHSCRGKQVLQHSQRPPRAGLLSLLTRSLRVILLFDTTSSQSSDNVSTSSQVLPAPGDGAGSGRVLLTWGRSASAHWWRGTSTAWRILSRGSSNAGSGCCRCRRHCSSALRGHHLAGKEELQRTSSGRPHRSPLPIPLAHDADFS